MVPETQGGSSMNEDKEFAVRDRRSAASDSTPPPEQQEKTGTAPGPETPRTEHEQGPTPELDFSSFVLSLAGTAQMSLGLIPHPETNLTVQNIPAAKQMIDILGMLKEKTMGNLSKDEAALLERVMFNLRLHYVRTIEEQKKSGRK
jgi:hypothetical protein